MKQTNRISKKLIALVAAAVMFVSAGAGAMHPSDRSYAPVVASAAALSQLGRLSTTVSSGAKSRNIGNHNYTWGARDTNTRNWADNSKSCLARNSDGTYTRAEYIDDKLVIETYTSAFSLKSTKTLALELPIFGGVFIGAKYNFVVCGQTNPKYSDSVEVLKVVKYNKSWTRLGGKALKGKNTYVPFEAGSLSMDESGGRLMIHTCHKMYPSERDGLNHQANMTFFIDEDSMAVRYENYNVWNISTGYVSHSFNQFIKTDGSYVYTADHGDAYPRSIVLVKRKMSGEAVSNATLLAFKGETGDNLTKATLGGMQLSESTVLTVGVSVAQNEKYTDNEQRNVFLSVASKSNLSSNKLIWLTKYAEGAGYSVCNPCIVKTGSNRFSVIWEEHKDNVSRLKCAVVNGSGSLSSNVQSFSEYAAEGLSDCAPIVSGNNIVWYSTGSRESSTKAAPVFYRLPVEFSSASVINITAQPKSVTVNSGAKLTLSVKATGTGLKYQWYLKKKGDTAWSKWSGMTAASVTAASKDSWNGMQVFCMITNAKGNTLKSNTVKLTVNIPLTVISQPVSLTVDSGKKISFSVKARGDGVKYQWYHKKKSETAWSVWSGKTSATVTETSKDWWDGMQVYCKLTDSKGKTVNSNTATLKLNIPLTITANPSSVSVSAGEKATFTVKARGGGLKYQWYIKKKGQTSWSVWSGKTAAAVTFTPDSSYDGMLAYCKVTDCKKASVKSSAGKLTLVYNIKILAQPKNQVVSLGKPISVSVKASGFDLKYQWYYMKKGETAWKKWNGKTSATLAGTLSESWSGAKLRCRVSDSSGSYLDSSAATVTLVKELTIVTQPADQEVNVGEKLRFSVKALGTGLKYQWYCCPYFSYYSPWEGQTSATTDAYADYSCDRMEVFCRITDASGKTVDTKKAIVHIMQPQEIQFSSCTTYTLRNTVSGDNVSYQWRYKKKGDSVWSEWKGYTSPEIVLPADMVEDGMLIHCRITVSGGVDCNTTYYHVKKA